jgi:hypothetical protein
MGKILQKYCKGYIAMIETLEDEFMYVENEDGYILTYKMTKYAARHDDKK